MKEKTDKILTWAMLLIAVLSTVFAFLFALNVEANPNSVLFDIVFFTLVAMGALSVIAALLFMFKSLVENGKIVKFVIGLVAVVAIIFGLYLVSNGADIPAAMLDRYGTTENTSKWIGAFCYLVYALVIGAGCAIIYSEIAKSLKKK